MKKRIVIVSGIQLTDNPRVLKEANEFAKLGYDVEVMVSITDPATASVVESLSHKHGWKYTAWLNRAKRSLQQRLRWQFVRLRKRLADELHARTGRESPAQLGYVAPEMLRAARLRRADLYSMHLYQSLWVGRQLLKEGASVAVDFEDWYSKDLLPEARRRMPIKLIRDCERELLRSCCYSLTTSKALAEALAKEYDAPTPSVLYNSFPLSDRDTIDNSIRDRVERDRFSICWFSQTIGPGRGLELLAEATHHLKSSSLEFHFRGTARHGYPDQLRALFPERLRSHVHFHDRVPHRELLARIAEHDIGFAAELSYCQSRNLTITNKILQYLLAGIPALASNTAGQMEVAGRSEGAVLLFSGESSSELAARLEEVVASKERLTAMKAAAFKVGQDVFCWERSAPVLAGCVSEIFDCV